MDKYIYNLARYVLQFGQIHFVHYTVHCLRCQIYKRPFRSHLCQANTFFIVPLKVGGSTFGNVKLKGLNRFDEDKDNIPHICHLDHLYIGGEKLVMWRNFRFQYMTDVEKSEISPRVEEFQIFHTTDVMRNQKFCQIWRNFKT